MESSGNDLTGIYKNDNNQHLKMLLKNLCKDIYQYQQFVVIENGLKDRTTVQYNKIKMKYIVKSCLTKVI